MTGRAQRSPTYHHTYLAASLDWSLKRAAVREPSYRGAQDIHLGLNPTFSMGPAYLWEAGQDDLLQKEEFAVPPSSDPPLHWCQASEALWLMWQNERT